MDSAKKGLHGDLRNARPKYELVPSNLLILRRPELIIRRALLGKPAEQPDALYKYKMILDEYHEILDEFQVN